MCIHEWLDEIFYYFERKFPYKQSHKVTPEYISKRYENAKLPKN